MTCWIASSDSKRLPKKSLSAPSRPRADPARRDRQQHHRHHRRPLLRYRLQRAGLRLRPLARRRSTTSLKAPARPPWRRLCPATTTGGHPGHGSGLPPHPRPQATRSLRPRILPSTGSRPRPGPRRGRRPVIAPVVSIPVSHLVAVVTTLAAFRIEQPTTNTQHPKPATQSEGKPVALLAEQGDPDD